MTHLFNPRNKAWCVGHVGMLLRSGRGRGYQAGHTGTNLLRIKKFFKKTSNKSDRENLSKCISSFYCYVTFDTVKFNSVDSAKASSVAFRAFDAIDWGNSLYFQLTKKKTKKP